MPDRWKRPSNRISWVCLNFFSLPSFFHTKSNLRKTVFRLQDPLLVSENNLGSLLSTNQRRAESASNTTSLNFSNAFSAISRPQSFREMLCLPRILCAFSNPSDHVADKFSSRPFPFFFIHLSICYRSCMTQTVIDFFLFIAIFYDLFFTPCILLSILTSHVRKVQVYFSIQHNLSDRSAISYEIKAPCGRVFLHQSHHLPAGRMGQC